MTWHTKGPHRGPLLILNDTRVIGSIARGSDGRWHVEIPFGDTDLTFDSAVYIHTLAFIEGVEKTLQVLGLIDYGKMYEETKKICHEFGMPWTDPRTGETHQPPEK